MINKLKVDPIHTKHYLWQLKAMRVITEAQYTALVVARQSGKTELLLWLLIDFMFNYYKFPNPRVLVAGATAESTFNNFFQRLHSQLKGLPPEIYHKKGSKSDPVHVNLYRPRFKDYVHIIFAGTGNVGSFRGGTFDLMLLDEYSLYPPDTWNAVLRPATKVRGAKVIFTGTPEGKNNPLYRELMLCKKEAAAGNKQYAAIHLDCYQAGVMTPKEIETERRAYESSGEAHLFHQELLVRFDAISHDEAPFNAKIMDMSDGKRDMTHLDKKLGEEKTRMNVVCDIGKAGNCATWFWIQSPIDQKPIIVAYEDRYNGVKALIEYCAKNFLEYQTVRITLPNDVMQPALMEGNTKLDVLHEFINKKGYGRKLELNVLPKTKDKNEMWQMGIQNFDDIRWDRNGTRVLDGLTKLGGVRFKRDKATGYVKFGDVVLDGNQHAADALMYLFADINDSRERMNASFNRLRGLDIGPSQASLRQYTAPDQRRYRW